MNTGSFTKIQAKVNFFQKYFSMHKEFLAMAQGIVDFSVQVFPSYVEEYGTMMVIPTSDGFVYITKEQARVFFGLTETL